MSLCARTPAELLRAMSRALIASMEMNTTSMTVWTEYVSANYLNAAQNDVMSVRVVCKQVGIMRRGSACDYDTGSTVNMPWTEVESLTGFADLHGLRVSRSRWECLTHASGIFKKKRD